MVAGDDVERALDIGNIARLALVWRPRPAGNSQLMIILGLVLLVLGFVLSIPILWTIGIVLLVVGAVLYILGSMDRAVGGRRHYW